MAEIIMAWMSERNRVHGKKITRCTKCNALLVRKAQQFFWRGETFDGAVCPNGHGLWSIVGEEMPPLRPAR